ncbi:hypothetical protein O3P69_013242 [Scylla paramamosain]|uniref:Major facilitator superfamily (MFS) profile domain-containing protein n=1 Tax=Scylla paramamosain TaxID=85552 RepID=A0AAW0TZ86_SCYPA
MMTEEAQHSSSQELRTDPAEVETVPHKGWAALVTIMALFTYARAKDTDVDLDDLDELFTNEAIHDEVGGEPVKNSSSDSKSTVDIGNIPVTLKMLVEDQRADPSLGNLLDKAVSKAESEDKSGIASMYGYSFGTIFSEYLMEIRASSMKVSWIYNLFHVTACLGSVMGATLVKELGWRKVIFASGLLTTLGMALSAFTTTADFLFFSYSILAVLNIRPLSRSLRTSTKWILCHYVIALS